MTALASAVHLGASTPIAKDAPESVRYNIFVMNFRRIILVLLLIAVPFQAAVGSTGFVCGHSMGQTGPGTVTAHGSHSVVPNHERFVHRHADSDPGSTTHAHHASGQGHSHAEHSGMVQIADLHDAAFDAGDAAHDDAGRCRLCSECNFSAAPACQGALQSGLQPSALKILAYADPSVLSHLGDGLFRPPRISRP